MDIEIWKPIPSHPKYQASSHGRIRGPKGHIKRQKYFGSCKRMGVHLYHTDGQRNRWIYVANLIAETFLGPRPYGLQISHRDEDKHNNRPDNLEYITQSENIQNSYNNNPNRRRVGGHPFKLTAQDYRTIWAMHCRGISQVKIGRHIGVTNSCISKILSGKVQGFTRFLNTSGQI